MENGSSTAAAAAATSACCQKLAEKLEKSENMRQKLRQAVHFLQEKMETTEKVLKTNEDLRQECEKERERAELERRSAEEQMRQRKELEGEAMALKETSEKHRERAELESRRSEEEIRRRKDLEGETVALKAAVEKERGKSEVERKRADSERKRAEEEIRHRKNLEGEIVSLKEQLAFITKRIEHVESLKALERTEIQGLRNEVRAAIDGVGMAVKSIEIAEDSYKNLEKSVLSKVKLLYADNSEIPKHSSDFPTGKVLVPRKVGEARAVSQKPSVINQKRVSSVETRSVDYNPATIGQAGAKPPLAKCPPFVLIPGIDSILHPPATKLVEIEPLSAESCVNNSKIPFIASKAGIVDGASAIVKQKNSICGPKELGNKGKNRSSACAQEDAVKDKNSSRDKKEFGKNMLVKVCELFEKQKKAHSKIEMKLAMLMEVFDPGRADQKLNSKDKVNDKFNNMMPVGEQRKKKRRKIRKPVEITKMDQANVLDSNIGFVEIQKEKKRKRNGSGRLDIGASVGNSGLDTVTGNQTPSTVDKGIPSTCKLQAVEIENTGDSHNCNGSKELNVDRGLEPGAMTNAVCSETPDAEMIDWLLNSMSSEDGEWRAIQKGC